MSYRFSELTFLSKDPKIEKINFTADDGEIINVVIQEPEKFNFFKRVLLGKEKNKTGRYQIDDIDIVSKQFVKNNVEYIKNNNLFKRLIPAKWVLALSLLFDSRFLRKAMVKYNEEKYNYFSFVASKNEINDQKVRKNIDKVMSQFITNSTTTEQKVLNDYLRNLLKYNQKKPIEIFNDLPPQIKVLSRMIENLKVTIRINQLMLMFQQIMWDNIYTFDELRDSCSCEYNVKRSSNKELKKDWKKFNYSQTKYVVAKQLKIIGSKITELRLAIYKDNKKLKQLQKQINFEFKKYFKQNNISKPLFSKTDYAYKNWQKTVEDQLTDIELKQKEDMLGLLRQECKLVGKQIAYFIHKYHEQIISGNTKYNNKNEYLVLKKYYKSQIKNVFQQATEWMSENVEKYNMKFQWFIKSSFQVSPLNLIYIKILKAINLSKKNIVFSNFTQLLTQKDFDKLINTIKRIQEFNPSLTFIFLNDSLRYVQDLSKLIYTVNNNNLELLSAEKIFDLGLDYDYQINFNNLKYQKTKLGQIEVENKNWNIQANYLKKTGTIFLNPFRISLNFSNSNDLPIILKLVKSNKFNDKNIYCGVTEYKTKIFFYNQASQLKISNKLVIYLNKESISKIVSEEVKDVRH
ncbi:hypothetical protein [Mycoplasma putrefaciens]|uniref:Uncharacterized protein n=1 Tax=Mycoplasma putrefaciens (strain ATCC 15718 / NCTC 10155 / C30 KS-1 / KS-1) TaxID=743965 RepID=A0A7U3ZT29_MYCPK|nr:hypothetical protein [Mycoplasma putrefaciens]AEM69018.1 uncharacterized protein MPUT_0681 [Mycoplasma putrefaciens KS1]